MTPRPIQPGDSVRLLAKVTDPGASAQAAAHQSLLVGLIGTVVGIHEYPGAEELLGFDHLYEVHVRPYASVPLRVEEIELVARPARITG